MTKSIVSNFWAPKKTVLGIKTGLDFSGERQKILLDIHALHLDKIVDIVLSNADDLSRLEGANVPQTSPVNIYNKLAAQLGVEPTRYLLFEISAVDIKSGNIASMVTCALFRGHARSQGLSDASN